MAEPLNMILIDNNKVTSYNFISGVKLDMEQVIELLERVPSVYSSYEDKKGYGVEQFSVRQLFNMYVSRDTKVVRFFDTMDDVVVIANDGIADIRLHLYYMLQSPGTNPAILGYSLLDIFLDDNIIYNRGLVPHIADHHQRSYIDDYNRYLLQYLQTEKLSTDIQVYTFIY